MQGNTALAAGEEVLRAQRERRLFPAQEGEHPHAGQALGYHRCQRRAAHAHAEDEDEHRVEHDVRHRADEHRVHTDARKALRRDEGVHAERQLHEYRAQRVYVHVVRGVAYGVFARAEGQQQAASPYQQRCRQHSRNAQLKRKAAAEGLLGAVMVAAPHEYRRTRRAARCGERRERRYYKDDRHTHADARQRKAAIAGHMPYVYAVDDVIEHVH